MKLVKPDVSITQLAPASVAGPAADDGLRVTHQPRRATEAKVADHLDFTAVYPSLFVLAERAAMKIVQDRATAEDVAADTMVRALASWGKVRGYARPWVTRVAVNRAIDVTRRRGRAVADLDQASGEESDHRRGSDELVVDRIELVAAIGKLSSRQRETIALRYLVGLDEHETATVLGVGSETVRSHTRRALQKLRFELSDTEELHHAAR